MSNIIDILEQAQFKQDYPHHRQRHGRFALAQAVASENSSAAPACDLIAPIWRGFSAP